MISYEQAGVSIERSNALVEILRKNRKTENVDGFAGLYEHAIFPEYYLAACTDGIGTKVIPLIERGLHRTIAQDLVAMNLNDLICTGAKPLFFLDYFATNRLDVESTAKFILSLREELEKYGCALLGGETSELGELIKTGYFDVGGTMVGAIRKDKVLKPDNVRDGDIIIALKSSGAHSSGYSLIRKLHGDGLLSDEFFEAALEPTHIYAAEIIALVELGVLNSAAHITGGGLGGNLPRAVPKHLCAKIYKEKIETAKQPLFLELERLVGECEAHRTFNMGVGFCLVCNSGYQDQIFEACKRFEPFVIGEVTKNEENTNICFR
jgi:phosphoribosylformylglycinamidine cyclo-ligase